MTIGTWEPQPEAPQSVDVTTLKVFLTLTDEQLEDIAAHLDTQLVERNQLLMKLDLNAWQAAAESLDDGAIHQLVRFFTLAEEQLPGWEAQDKSPVIWLCKILKQRGLFPDKELTRWIKAHSKNRFLPYGSVL